MSSQNSISDPAVAYAGQNAIPRYSYHAEAGHVEGAGVTAGLPLKRGSTDREASVFTTADLPDSETFLGFALHDVTRPTGGIEDEDPVTIFKKGFIYLLSDEAVAKGEQVAFDLSGQTYSGLGLEEVPGADVVVLPGCRWEETTSASGLAVAFVDVQGPASGSKVVSQSWTKSADDSLAADATAEVPIGVVTAAKTVRSVKYVPQAVLTADDADYATITVYKRASDGGSQVAVASVTTETTGSGDWTAFAPVDLTISTAAVEAGSSLTVAITKTGSGVVVTAGELVLELTE